jgi:hypothetical protein
MTAYILSEPYKKRVDAALATVEGMPSQQKTTLIPTRFETLQQPGASNTLRLAAYPRDVEWKKGSTVEVTLYTQSGSGYGPAMETLSDGSKTPKTVSVTNVSNDFGVHNQYGTGEDVGPTPTMTWCVIGKPAAADQYVAIEGPYVPVQLATISAEQMGQSWAKGSAKTVEITATGQTVEVYSVLDAHTKLDFPNGLVFTKSVDPTDPTKTANVVISPPAIPLHEARFSEGNIDEEWERGATKQLLVTREDGEEVEVEVENKFFDTFSPGTASLAIGRFGTTFSVITGPASGEVTPGTLVTPIAPGETWDAGSLRSIQVTGTTNQVDVLNPFDELTELEGHKGVLFAKSSKDPLGGEGTTNILISPAPRELWEARFSDGNDDDWPTGEEKELLVPAGDGRDGDLLVTVKNKFFDTFTPGTASMAIGRIDDEFCVLTNPSPGGEVTPGTLVTPIAPGETWQAGSLRSIQVTGTTNQVDVLNPFDDLTHLEGHEGVLFAKSSKDPLGGEGTTNILISPAPKELWEARFSDGNDEDWPRGESKELLVPPSDGRDGDVLVTVKNKFFDTFSPGTAAMAIGRVGDEFCVLTGKPESVFRVGTFTGSWSINTSKTVTLRGSTDTKSALNLFAGITSTSTQTKNCAIAKDGTAWYLIAAQC